MVEHGNVHPRDEDQYASSIFYKNLQTLTYHASHDDFLLLLIF